MLPGAPGSGKGDDMCEATVAPDKARHQCLRVHGTGCNFLFEDGSAPGAQKDGPENLQKCAENGARKLIKHTFTVLVLMVLCLIENVPGNNLVRGVVRVLTKRGRRIYRLSMDRPWRCLGVHIYEWIIQG